MFYNLFTIILLVITTQTYARTEDRWVDPHSLDGNIRYKDECACETTDAPRDIILSHYQRTLNLLLKSLNYNPDINSYKTRITIDLPADEYNFIKGFSDRGVINNDEWNKLDTILTRIYTKSRSDELMDVFMSWRDLFVFYFYSKEALISLGVAVCLVFVYNLLNARIKTWTVFKYFLLVLFLIDFGFVWIRLLQEVEVEKIVNSLKYKSMPADCDPNKMGFFQFVKHTFSSDNGKCKEYHNAMFADDLWKVNPLKVLGTQMGDLIQTPANAFGTAFGQFTSAIIGSMSWYMAPLMPVILIFILLIICIMLSFLTKTSFGFNFLYLIQFNFGKGDREKVDDVISGKHLKTIMKFLHNKSPAREGRAIDNNEPRNNTITGRPVLSSIEDVQFDETRRTSVKMIKNKPAGKNVTFGDDFIIEDKREAEGRENVKRNTEVEIVNRNEGCGSKAGINEAERRNTEVEIVNRNEGYGSKAKSNEAERRKDEGKTFNRNTEMEIGNKNIKTETVNRNEVCRSNPEINAGDDAEIEIICANKAKINEGENVNTNITETCTNKAKSSNEGGNVDANMKETSANEAQNVKMNTQITSTNETCEINAAEIEKVTKAETDKVSFTGNEDTDISLTCSDDDIEVIEDCGDEKCKCRPRVANEDGTIKAKPSGQGDYF